MIERFFITGTFIADKSLDAQEVTIINNDVYAYNRFREAKKVEFTPNFNMEVLSIGISAGHGVINADCSSVMSLAQTLGARIVPIFSQFVPFFPCELPIGRILPDFEGDREENGARLSMVAKIVVAKGSIPDYMDGKPIQVAAYFTANIDQNAYTLITE